MFKIKRKIQQPPPSSTTIVSSSNSIHRTNLLVSSSSSACSNRYYSPNSHLSHPNVSISSSASVSPQVHKYKKSSHQQRTPTSKHFLAFHRLIHTIMNKIQQNLIDKIVQVYHRLIPPITVVNSSIDFLLSTEHFSHTLTTSTCSQRDNSYLLFVFFFLLLLPLTMSPAAASTPTQFTASNRQILFFIDDSNSSSSSSSITPLLVRKPQWHAGCCIKSKKASLAVCDVPLNSTMNIFEPNVFIEMSAKIDFLNNETLFCERFDKFRHLSSNTLATFTYTIVVVGIMLNTFVFLVLMCGSLRRSTSFVLFLALTCFDLLSLASSLFSLLFRTVMTYLKASAPFCKMFGIFFLYFRQCSSSTLLLIAVERCIVIKYPFCRHTFNRFRLPLLVSIMLIFVLPIPFDFIFYTSGSLHCEAFDTLQADRYQIFRGFFTVFSYAIVPFVGISISNLLIVVELKKSRKRFQTKDENGTMRRFSTNVVDKRGTTVMLLVASIAFLILLGPFYVHWCLTYIFSNYPQCQFTRNLYENVQVCMGVFHPYLTVIEKGMRESNHAINFLLYWATSTRFRMDFKRICRSIFVRTIGTAIVFCYRYVCPCCPSEPSCLATLERHVSEITDFDSSYESNRKNHMAYKTSHYYSNFERRRQHQLVQATLLNSSLGIDTNLTPATSLHTLTANTSKTVRMLTLNPHDPLMRQLENKRQAARLSKHLSISGGV